MPATALLPDNPQPTMHRGGDSESSTTVRLERILCAKARAHAEVALLKAQNLKLHQALEEQHQQTEVERIRRIEAETEAARLRQSLQQVEAERRKRTMNCFTKHDTLRELHALPSKMENATQTDTTVEAGYRDASGTRIEDTPQMALNALDAETMSMPGCLDDMEALKQIEAGFEVRLKAQAAELRVVWEREIAPETRFSDQTLQWFHKIVRATQIADSKIVDTDVPCDVLACASPCAFCRGSPPTLSANRWRTLSNADGEGVGLCDNSRTKIERVRLATGLASSDLSPLPARGDYKARLRRARHSNRSCWPSSVQTSPRPQHECALSGGDDVLSSDMEDESMPSRRESDSEGTDLYI